MTTRTKRLLWLMSQKPKLRTFSGVPPLTFKAKKSGTLKNYRIYGNTVNGESVGDRTANLFDGNFLQGYWAYADGEFIYVNTWICTTKIPCTGGRTYTYSFSNVSRWTGFVWYDADGNYISTNNRQDDSDTQYRLYFAEAPSNAEFMTINIAGYPNYSATILPSDIADFMLVEGFTPLPYEPYGYKVPVTVEGKNLLPNADWVEGYITIAGGIAQPSPSNQEITSPFVKVIPGKTYVFSYYPNEGEPWRAVIYYTKDKRFIKRQSAASSASPVAFTVESGVGYVRFSYRSYGDGTFSQLELGDIVTDYEPYHAPVTTNIYIPEQLKMVGDKAEYVDYKEQKQHFADGTSTDVLLPTLPTLSGINTLSVATSVQPSNIEITGKIKGVTA